MSFTLFVILPNEDVCSLRSVTSGTSIRVVRKKLELAAGLPAQTYRLTCPEGRLLHEDHVLKLDSNVWDGFIVRAVFLDSWQELYERVVAGDVAHVLQDGGVHLPSDVVWADARDEVRAREVMGERGVVALFLASFLGMQDLCRALLSVGEWGSPQLLPLSSVCRGVGLPSPVSSVFCVLVSGATPLLPFSSVFCVSVSGATPLLPLSSVCW